MLILSCVLADPEEVIENVKLLSVERHDTDAKSIL